MTKAKLSRVLLPLWVLPMTAAVFQVNTTSDLPDALPGDGQCMTAAGNCSLRAAVMEANALPGTHTIILPAGTYALNTPAEGGADQGDLDIYGTIEINGAGMDSTAVDGSGRFRVFDVAAGANLTLRDLAVQNGLVEDVCGETCRNAGEFGGGLRNASNASLSLYRVRVTHNRTLLNSYNMGGFGGGIHNASLLYMEDCEVTNNQTTGSRWNAHGGGISNFYGAAATIVRTLFQYNKAALPKGGEGGAIYNWPSATLTVTDSSFLDNEAGVPFQQNSDGGAIANDNGAITLRNCTLARNRNYGYGAGGGILNRGNLSLFNCTLSANYSTCDGGGIATDPTFYIRNCTFYGNRSDCSGGGFKGNAEVWNSILAGNSAAGGTNECTSMISHGYNLVQGVCYFTAQPGDKLNQDPMLGPLQDNGGPTQTQALAAGSPAIDAGNPNTPGSSPDACEPADQRGVTRPQGLYCDMGAYEFTAPAPPSVTLTFPAPGGQNGWFLTSPVVGSITATSSLSTIAGISCSGAQLGAISGLGTSSATAQVSVAADGASDVSCTATDAAGYSSDPALATVKLDTTPPAILLASRTPQPNPNGWNNSAVTLTWTCTDTISGPLSPTVSNSLSTEGANQSLTGQCADLAGNTAAATVTGINIDTHAPAIAFASRNPAPNGAGWNNTAVTVTWTCTDALSGPVAGTVTRTASGEGAGQLLVGQCSDLAGNDSSQQYSEAVNIDFTPPAVTVTGVTNNATYLYGSVPAAGCSTRDLLSGTAAGATLTLSETNAQGYATDTATCSGAVDKAGNGAPSAAVTYTVTFTGMVPISGTACNGSYDGTFKGNLTISKNQTVSLSMAVTGGGAFSINVANIGSNLQVQNLPPGAAQNQVCGATIGGDLQYHNNATAIQIGGESSACAGNIITGNLQVHDNSAATLLIGNNVHHDLQDNNNTGAAQVVDNMVGNNLQCQNNTAITGGGNTAKQKQGQCAAF
jgi:CSLREA domain-containing protein